MASLLALMNRAVSYFKESKSGMSGTNIEVSTDDESNCGSSVDGMSTDEIITYEYAPKSQCSTCSGYAYNEYYNYERQRCNDCSLLTEEGEKRCDECKEFKHVILY
jgi:hypothetical protein